MPETLSELIYGFCGITDRGIYFYDQNEFRSYDNLYHLVVEKRNYLLDFGITNTDRVVTSLNAELENVTFLFALLMIGAVPISIKPKDHYSSNYSDYVLKIAQQNNATFIASNIDANTSLQRIDITAYGSTLAHFHDVEIDPNKVAFIQYSSGSTSSPKGVPLNHRAILHNINQIVVTDDRCHSSMLLNVLPICHDMGMMGGLLSNFVYFNNIFLSDTKSFLRNPIRLLKIAMEKGADISVFPNTILGYLARILSTKKDVLPIFDSFKTIYVGAEPIRKSTIGHFLEIAGKYGLIASDLLFCYGLAESTLIVTAKRFSTLDDCFDDSVSGVNVANTGKPINGIEIMIGDPGKDGVGKVMIRGSSLFCGYTQDIDHTQQWFDTGDIGYLKQGELYLSGRAKEIIIISGENYYANDIEEHLYANFDLAVCLAVQSDLEFIILYSVKGASSISIDDINHAITCQFGISPSQIISIQPNDVIRTTSGKPIKNLTLQKLAMSIQ